MFDTSAVLCIDKIVTCLDGVGIIDIRPIEEKLALARAIRKRVDEVRVAVLDRPLHARLIDEIRKAIRRALTPSF